MQYLRCSIAALFCLAGCNSDTAIYIPGGYPTVNDELRSVCATKYLGYEDETIGSILSAAEAAMQEGYSKAQTINSIEGSCIYGCQDGCAQINAGECPSTQVLDCITFCGECISAIVSQVYGY